MATAPAKSPLHNFPLTFLRWGSNNRCRRPASAGASESPEIPGRRSRAARNRQSKEIAGGEGEAEAEAEESAMAAEQKPWNLRPRKALFSKAAKKGGGGGGEFGELKSTRSQQQAMAASLEKTEVTVPAKEKEKMFLIELSKDEIEEDVFIMTGSRPVRRPRKRPKNVQKQLDNVFPGLWLVGVTADAFRIAEPQPKR